jgi:peptide/nickel transport system permease protein
MGYVLRRAVHSVLVLFGVSALSFILIDLAGGDYFDEARLSPGISATTIDELRRSHGLGQPLPVRYGRWLLSVARGEFGVSLAYNQSVVSLLLPRARNTLLLTVPAMMLSWLFAIPLGVWWAWRPRSILSRFSAAGTAAALALPEIVIALMLLALAVRTGWFPAGGMTSPVWVAQGFWVRAGDIAAHMALPVTAIVLGCAPALVRHVHAAMTEVLAAPFLRAARGHGIPTPRLLFRHALPAAANPLVALFGYSAGALLSESLLAEVILNWPGIGPFLLEAVFARDAHVVAGATLMSAILLLAGNLFADMALYWLDPRIRIGTRGAGRE